MSNLPPTTAGRRWTARPRIHGSPNPDSFTVAQLAERTLARRAVEAAIWGMPIVSFEAMRRAFLHDAGARYNDIVYLSRPADWRFRIPTPNAAARYVYMQIDTRDGPLVLDVPPARGAGLFGSLLDAWQTPVVDVGPAGEDRGRGGRYLLLPPGWEEPAREDHIPARFATFRGYAALRAVPASSSAEDAAAALHLVRQLRLYPLAQADDPPEQRFVDMSGRMFDGIVRFDASFFEALARLIDEEPVLPRDLAAMGQLRSLGIRRGERFTPNLATRAVLEKSIAEAHAVFMKGAVTGPRYWPGAHWITVGAGVGPRTHFTFETEDRLEVDERGVTFFLGCAPPRKLGAASFYLWGVRDAEGAGLIGGESYCLRVPPDVPASQFWAVTVYDLETAAFFRDAPRVEVNSYDPRVERNADGSVDVLFGPATPPRLQTNWIPTLPGKTWIAAFRFYGPEDALVERSWVLGEITRTRHVDAKA